MKIYKIPEEIKNSLTLEKQKNFVLEVKNGYNQTEDVSNVQLDYMGTNLVWVESFKKAFHDDKIILDYFENCGWEESDHFVYEFNKLLFKNNLVIDESELLD